MKKNAQQNSVLEEIIPDLKKVSKILGIVGYLLQSFVFSWHGLKKLSGLLLPCFIHPPDRAARSFDYRLQNAFLRIS